MKNRRRIFYSITFHTKVLLILSLYVSGSIKKKDLLKFMIELDI